MKVLKAGRVSGSGKPWRTKVVCRKRDQFDSEGCGAQLAVTEKDLVMMYYLGTHFQHFYAAVKCPLCGHYTAPRDIPGPVWSRLDTAAKRAKAVFDGVTDVC